MSARSLVRDTATQYGWERTSGERALVDEFERGEWLVCVEFDARATIRSGERFRAGLSAGTTLPQGKRLTVQAWLGADPDSRPLTAGGAR